MSDTLAGERMYFCIGRKIFMLSCAFFFVSLVCTSTRRKKEKDALASRRKTYLV